MTTPDEHQRVLYRELREVLSHFVGARHELGTRLCLQRALSSVLSDYAVRTRGSVAATVEVEDSSSQEFALCLHAEGNR